MTRSKKSKLVRAKQQKRRRCNNRDVLYCENLFLMIDGNETHYPYAYCKHYRGYLTKSLAITHRCEAKQCCCFSFFESEVENG